MKESYAGHERRQKFNRRGNEDRRTNPHVNSDPNERKYDRRSKKERRTG